MSRLDKNNTVPNSSLKVKVRIYWYNSDYLTSLADTIEFIREAVEPRFWLFASQTRGKNAVTPAWSKLFTHSNG